MDVLVYTIEGELNAALFAVNLISAGVWLESQPTDTDQWTFAVRQDDFERVKEPSKGLVSLRYASYDGNTLVPR